MLLRISGLLDEAALAEVQGLAAGLAWREGRETAGAAAGAVKRNLQADLTSRDGVRLRKQLMSAIKAHPVLQAAAWPRQFSRLLVTRTGEGGGYGLHVDNALMGEGAARLRSDLAFTLFLSEPDSYGGGELVIEWAGTRETVKPAAGELVLYPARTLHRVSQVTFGERLAAVGWIESHVRSGEAREVLFDLSNLRASLAGTHDAQSPELLTLQKTIANLLRLWADA